MHFSQAVAIIQTQVGTIKNVQTLYSEQVGNPVQLVVLVRRLKFLFFFVFSSYEGPTWLWHRNQLAIEWTAVDFWPNIPAPEGNWNLQHETRSPSVLRASLQFARNSPLDRTDRKLIRINTSCHLWRCQELFCVELPRVDLLLPCRQQDAGKFC
jgi:hypothetical protein